MCNRVNRDKKKKKPKKHKFYFHAAIQLNITYPGMILYSQKIVFTKTCFYRVGPKVFLILSKVKRDNNKIIKGCFFVALALG